jgi:hypothetical protein
VSKDFTLQYRAVTDLRSIMGIVFIAETKRVYCAVRMVPINTIHDNANLNRAMAQAVSRRSLTVETRFRSRVSPSEHL